MFRNAREAYEKDLMASSEPNPKTFCLRKCKATEDSITGTVSQSKAVVSGVSQGSVLGTILFLIYANVLPDLLQGYVLLFAYYVKLISAIVNFNDLQHDLQHAWD